MLNFLSSKLAVGLLCLFFIHFSEVMAIEDSAALCTSKCTPTACAQDPGLLVQCADWCIGSDQRDLYRACKNAARAEDNCKNHCNEKECTNSDALNKCKVWCGDTQKDFLDACKKGVILAQKETISKYVEHIPPSAPSTVIQSVACPTKDDLKFLIGNPLPEEGTVYTVAGNRWKVTKVMPGLNQTGVSTFIVFRNDKSEKGKCVYNMGYKQIIDPFKSIAPASLTLEKEK